MSKTQVMWMIRDNSGKVLGPYSTEAVFRLISEGVLSGGELISKVPRGEWVKISREVQFYDKLIEALEGVVEVDPSKVKKMEAETVITNTDRSSKTSSTNSNATEDGMYNPLGHFSNSGQSNIFNQTKTNPLNPPPTPKTSIVITQDQTVPPVSAHKVPKAPEPEVLELQNLNSLKRDKVRATIKKPMVLLAVALLLVFWLLLGDEQSGDERIHLLVPSTGSETLGADEIQGLLTSARKAFVLDTFEGYLDAQNKLVKVIEGAPKHLGARGMLCLVYKELWPFAHQDSRDIQTVSFLAQSTRALNVISVDGYYCEVVKLLTMGRYSEASGTVEQALDVRDVNNVAVNSNAVALIFLKGELAGGDPRTRKEAIYYLDSAINLWPEWIKVRSSLADLYRKKEQYQEAAQIYKTILDMNPQHKRAKIYRGIILYKTFRQVDEAQTLLASGLNSSSKVDKLTEAQGWITLAEIVSEKGDREKALSYARKGYRLSPTNNEARQILLRLGGSEAEESSDSRDNELLFLGDQYQRAGDNLAAQAEYKAAYELDPKNGIAAYKAAKCLWALNQSFDAIDWLNKAIKADPKLIQAYTLQADYLSQRHNYQQALNVLKNVASIAGGNPEVLKAFALMEFRRNNLPVALDFAQKAMKAYDGDVETIVLASKIFLAKGEFKEAFRFAVKAIEYDNSNTEAQINYAVVLSKFQGAESGILYLTDLIKKYPYTLEYRDALANIYKGEERFKESQQMFQQIVDSDPKFKKAVVGLAESLQSQGLFDMALKRYLEASVLDPSDAEPLYKIGLMYLESGKYEESIRQLERVAKLNPLFPRVNYFIGKAFFFMHDHESAMKAAEAERKLNPNIADSYLLAAEIYSAQRHYQKCADEYNKAIKLRPQGTEIYVRLAYCYRSSGNLDVAEAMLTVAASKESGYADIYKEQGLVFEQKGEGVAAAQAFGLYLQLAPNARDRATFEQKCQNLIQAPCPTEVKRNGSSK